MPSITIDGRVCEFKPGQMIIQVANEAGRDIPQYCYHDGLSIVASCRICLAEVWQPNPRNNNALEPLPKLVPTCQTACADGMVVYTDSPKAVANQKAVMEYLLINHPLDCPVCDQSGECHLQDYSYEYGRGTSRFEEDKVKQPKKDLGPHVYLYADRCIMCTRCVRFTREVSGTAELLVQGRGNREEIDIFPGVPLNNELSANVVDLCPVGALLDKDFLFAQRVWFLKQTPSIDGLTAGGDNIRVDHNEGRVYRIKPRTNMAVNKWWISDEVRYGWKHVHSEARIKVPLRRQHGVPMASDWNRALTESVGLLRAAGRSGSKRLGAIISPNLSCEDAFALAQAVFALDERAVLAIGPVPVQGQDRTYPPGDSNGFRTYAEKAPNARGVERVLKALATGHGAHGSLVSLEQLLSRAKGGEVSGVLVTGNYPSRWSTPAIMQALGDRGQGPVVVLIDTLESDLSERADVVLPGATWLEKAGSFENARGMIQAFEQAIPCVGLAKAEAQIGLDLLAEVRDLPRQGEIADRYSIVDEQPGTVPTATAVLSPRTTLFNAAAMRQAMREQCPALSVMVTDIHLPALEVRQEPDMAIVEI